MFKKSSTVRFNARSVVDLVELDRLDEPFESKVSREHPMARFGESKATARNSRDSNEIQSILFT